MLTMHHTWNALIINKESGLVRMFQAEESLPHYMMGAYATLQYAVSQGLVDPSDADVTNLLARLKVMSDRSKKILSPRSNGSWYTDDELTDVYELEKIMPKVEWHLFLSSMVKPEKWRNSIEVAAFLSGLNPVARYLPFSEEYSPPSDAQLGKLVDRVIETKCRLKDFGVLDNSLSEARIALFWEKYIKQRFYDISLPEEHWESFFAVFDKQISELAKADPDICVIRDTLEQSDKSVK